MRKVNHHRNVKHKEAHKPSRFSLFKHKIASIFKEIVEVPPEEIKPVELEPVETAAVVQKEPEEEVDDEPSEEEKPNELHREILSSLNEAVARWKETGEVGVHLEAPVPLREKVKTFLSNITHRGSPISAKLKDRIEEVAEKVSLRVKKAEVSGENVDTNSIVRDEWKNILEKMESVSKRSERAEIEKIYKELVGK